MLETKPNVAVVHSNPLFRAGLISLLAEGGAYDVSGTDGTTSLKAMIGKDLHPDAVLIELQALNADTATFVAELRASVPSCRVVLLAISSDAAQFAALYSAGADGVILQSVGGETLRGSLKLILLGEKLFPSPLPSAFSNGNHAQIRVGAVNGSPMPDLSEREREILSYLVEGYSNKRIANQLSIAEATVKVHLKSILRKTRVVNRTQAAIWALQRGMAILATCTAVMAIQSEHSVASAAVEIQMLFSGIMPSF